MMRIVLQIYGWCGFAGSLLLGIENVLDHLQRTDGSLTAAIAGGVWVTAMAVHLILVGVASLIPVESTVERPEGRVSQP